MTLSTVIRPDRLTIHKHAARPPQHTRGQRLALEVQAACLASGQQVPQVAINYGQLAMTMSWFENPLRGTVLIMHYDGSHAGIYAFTETISGRGFGDPQTTWNLVEGEPHHYVSNGTRFGWPSETGFGTSKSVIDDIKAQIYAALQQGR